MCTALFLWDSHPTILFLLAFNRDETFKRHTQHAHFWEAYPDILGGRDIQGGGTWLAISRSGRFAMLTNFREVLALTGDLQQCKSCAQAASVAAASIRQGQERPQQRCSCDRLSAWRHSTAGTPAGPEWPGGREQSCFVAVRLVSQAIIKQLASFCTKVQWLARAKSWQASGSHDTWQA